MQGRLSKLQRNIMTLIYRRGALSTKTLSSLIEGREIPRGYINNKYMTSIQNLIYKGLVWTEYKQWHTLESKKGRRYNLTTKGKRVISHLTNKCSRPQAPGGILYE